MQLYDDASNAYDLAPQLLRRKQNTKIIFLMEITKSFKKESTSLNYIFISRITSLLLKMRNPNTCSVLVRWRLPITIQPLKYIPAAHVGDAGDGDPEEGVFLDVDVQLVVVPLHQPGGVDDNVTRQVAGHHHGEWVQVRVGHVHDLVGAAVCRVYREHNQALRKKHLRKTSRSPPLPQAPSLTPRPPTLQFTLIIIRDFADIVSDTWTPCL